jgi:hypothetical protein
MVVQVAPSRTNPGMNMDSMCSEHSRIGIGLFCPVDFNSNSAIDTDPDFFVAIYFRYGVAKVSLPVLYSFSYSGAKHERHTGIAC